MNMCMKSTYHLSGKNNS